MSVSIWKQVCVVAWSIALLPVLTASAQDGVGIVRISDGPKSGVEQAGHKSGKRGAAMYGDYAGDCQQCRGGKVKGCKHCGGAGCGHCKHHGCFGHCLGCCFQEHYCTNSPDYGFSIPGKWPVLRRGVQYNQYFPTSWYGANGTLAADVSYPMVYQPTDTAQLGFYYQHVPFWMPQPNPLPPRPLPAQWHNYAPAVTASAFHHGWAWGYGPGGMCDYPVISTDGTTMPAGPTELQPVPLTEPAPAPKPPEESAVDVPFRRVSVE